MSHPNQFNKGRHQAIFAYFIHLFIHIFNHPQFTYFPFDCKILNMKRINWYFLYLVHIVEQYSSSEYKKNWSILLVNGLRNFPYTHYWLNYLFPNYRTSKTSSPWKETKTKYIKMKIIPIAEFIHIVISNNKIWIANTSIIITGSLQQISINIMHLIKRTMIYSQNSRRWLVWSSLIIMYFQMGLCIKDRCSFVMGRTDQRKGMDMVSKNGSMEQSIKENG